MNRSREETHRRILHSAYRLFFSKGFTRVGMDAIAATAAVTKQTLYAHFRSKDDLLAEVMEEQASMALRHTAKFKALLEVTAEGFLRVMFDELADWMEKPRAAGSGFTRIVIELADLPGHPAREIASRHKRAFASWLAQELRARGVADAQRVATKLQMIIEGAQILTLMHGGRESIVTAADAALTILAASGAGRGEDEAAA